MNAPTPSRTKPMQALHDALSTLLLYPDADATSDLVTASRVVEQEATAFPDLQQAAASFRAFLESTDDTKREELFTGVFDINPTCTMELGWHLYGEDYKRGSFLVDMRKTMHMVGVEESAELPDHLTHALRVLGRLPTPKDVQFSTDYVQPAIAKMLEGYTDASSPWQPLLTAVLGMLVSHYGETNEIVGNPSAESQGPYEPVSPA